jgi:hypothetical protein
MTEKKEITPAEWSEMYLSPFASDEALRAHIETRGGFEGWVLDGVLSVKDIGGEHATDGECLDLVASLIEVYYDATARGFG